MWAMGFCNVKQRRLIQTGNKSRPSTKADFQCWFMFQFIKYQQQIIWDSADRVSPHQSGRRRQLKIWFQTQDKDTKIKQKGSFCIFRKWVKASLCFCKWTLKSGVIQYRANSDLVVLSEITEVGERRGGAPTKLRGWGCRRRTVWAFS